MTKQEKKYYEVGGALIKADDPKQAMELYKEEIGDDVELSGVQQVKNDYALCAFSKGHGLDGKPAPVSNTLAWFYKDESEIMLYPSDIE